ncbi:MAG: argininosuccinate lyase [Bacteroidota bacterium]
MKLWQKEHTSTSEKIEAFTVGRDKEFDMLLAQYDVEGSLAHTAMLCSIGLLREEELTEIHKALHAILVTIRQGDFKLDEEVEDIHSQIELMLTKEIGEVGKKIHSGRSRNDQVLVDVKLYLRAEVKKLAKQVNALFNQLLELSEQHKAKLLPGYTHFQLAMPSSFGLWFAAYAESLTDDMEFVQAAYNVCNKNPLGSGAGYGSSFPLNRGITTELLQFESMNVNVVYAQMTRGKSERSVAVALAAVAATLSKLAYDVCLYMNQNFAFVSFPDDLTTGSSIMPHKKNPDVFELIRAKCNRIQSVPNELVLLTNNLPSGYHRDMQLTKEILFPAMEELQACIDMTGFMLQHIIIKDHILEDEKYTHLFSVERVNELVLNGTPFRDAYKIVGEEIETGTFKAGMQVTHTHEGSIGNLCNEEIKKQMARFSDLLY